MPKSTTFRMVISTVLMMVRPPGEPVTMNNLPSLARMVGDMLDSGRLPGMARFGLVPMLPRSSVISGAELKSPSSLLSRKPAPGTTMREP